MKEESKWLIPERWREVKPAERMGREFLYGGGVQSRKEYWNI